VFSASFAVDDRSPSWPPGTAEAPVLPTDGDSGMRRVWTDRAAKAVRCLWHPTPHPDDYPHPLLG